MIPNKVIAIHGYEGIILVQFWNLGNFSMITFLFVQLQLEWIVSDHTDVKNFILNDHSKGSGIQNYKFQRIAAHLNAGQLYDEIWNYYIFMKVGGIRWPAFSYWPFTI